jgi:hypothetical protein
MHKIYISLTVTVIITLGVVLFGFTQFPLAPQKFDRQMTQMELRAIYFALMAYKNEKGDFPKTLGALAGSRYVEKTLLQSFCDWHYNEGFRYKIVEGHPVITSNAHWYNTGEINITYPPKYQRSIYIDFIFSHYFLLLLVSGFLLGALCSHLLIIGNVIVNKQHPEESRKMILTKRIFKTVAYLLITILFAYGIMLFHAIPKGH